MKIKYRQLRLRYNKIFGFGFLGIALLGFSTHLNVFFNYGHLLISLLYFASYIFESSKQYLSIEDQKIIKNTIFPQTVHFSEIMGIKIFPGLIKIETPTSYFKIKTGVIAPASLRELQHILADLDTATLENHFKDHAI